MSTGAGYTYEKKEKPATERLKWYWKRTLVNKAMKHDEAVILLHLLYNETGAYDKAIDIMTARHFTFGKAEVRYMIFYVMISFIEGMVC